MFISKADDIYDNTIGHLVNFPAELKELKCWVNHTNKEPFQPNGKRASTTDPSTWSSFDDCVAAKSKFDGVGIVLNAPLIGIDLDHVRDPDTGILSSEAREIVDSIATYWEISPSGTGLHGYCFGELPAGARNRTRLTATSAIEIYDSARYFTVTGERFTGEGVEDNSEQLPQLYSRFFPAPEPPATLQEPSVSNLSDAQLIEKASQNESFKSLWDGDFSRFASQSEADLKLCSSLAFWTGKDAQRIDLLFRQSRLYRDKWKRGDYRDPTIKLAISGCKNTYSPSHSAAEPENERNRNVSYTNDDLGNALRFVDMHKDSVRFCADNNRWYIWDGRRWAPSANVQELCRTTVETMQRAAAVSGDESFKRWAARSGMSDKLNAMSKVASSRPEIAAALEGFNTHPSLLTCSNGVLNLYTGELKPHDRSLMLTQLCPTNFNPNANHEDWENVLGAALRKHPDILSWMQQFLGYTAQGNKSEELVVIFYGPGGTGKSTLLSCVQSALGSSFVRSVASSSILKSDRAAGGASGDIARLQGSRLAIVSEFDKNAKLNESFLKLASGGDKIVARRLYSEEMEFTPTFQMIFQTNNRPVFNGTDSGMMRRVVQIPMDNVIATDSKCKYDPMLKERLATDPKVHEAILRWIVDGCVAWRKRSILKELPVCMKESTQQLFKDNDVLSDFFADCLVLSPEGQIPKNEMLSSYESWCRDSHIQNPYRTQTFNKMLAERGLAEGRTNSCRFWRGATLRKPTAKSPYQFSAKKQATIDSMFEGLVQ